MNKKKQRIKLPPLYKEEAFQCILNKQRHILLFSDINAEIANNVVTKIYAMNEINKKAPIVLEINSPGGSVADGFAIINAIKSSAAPIITLINGEACSMAAYISIFGNKRYMYKNSFWMMHPMSSGVNDYVSFIKDRAKYLSVLDNIMIEILKQKTKLSKVDIEKAINGELWFNAEQCLARGVVDKLA